MRCRYIVIAQHNIKLMAYVPGLKDKPYLECLVALKLPSLSYRSSRGDLIELYKHTHGYYTADADYINFDNQNRHGHYLKLKKKSDK